MKLAPIVLFVYNRPLHTMQTVKALQQNELAKESELFIYSDAPANEKSVLKVNEVRSFIKSIEGFNKITIIERAENWGLADSIIAGVTEIVNKYGKIIVLEDDLVTSPMFLKFMNEALEMYRDEDTVASIHGYVYPINDLPNTFFLKGADCWGWATWARAWKLFEPDGRKLLKEIERRNLKKEADFNHSYALTKMLKNQIHGKNSSWAIRWFMSTFLKDKLTLYPGKSFVQNMGNDSSGRHSGVSDNYLVLLSKEYKMQRIEIKEDDSARQGFEIFFKSLKKGFLNRLKIKIQELL